MVRIFLVVWVLWGLALGAVRVAHPGLESGFSWNDAHILVASDWFATHGHWGTWLVPPRQTAPRHDGSTDLYNTFPAGVFWLHELRRALGATELWHHRTLALVWNHAAVLVLFLLVRRVTRQALIAGAAAGLYMFSGPYATSAGGFWEHAPMLTMLGTLLAWFEFERARSRTARTWWLAAATIAFTLENLLSVQHTVMIGALVGSRALWLARRDKRRARPWVAPLAAALIVLSAAPAVMAGRLLVQAHLAGGIDQALEYMTRKVEQRMGDEADGGRPMPSLWPLVGARLGLPASISHDVRGLQGLYPAFHPVALGGAAVILAAAWVMRRSPHLRAARRGLGLGAALLGASMTWPLLFGQHTIIHPFTTLTFMPGAAVLAGTLATLPVFVRRAARAQGRPRRPLAAAGLILASAAVCTPPLMSMRLSEVLNSAVPLHGRVRGLVEHTRLNYAALESLRPCVRNFRMVHLTTGGPITAHLLGLPYAVFRGLGSGRTPTSPDLLLAVGLYDRAEREKLYSLLSLPELPLFMAAPGDMVFAAPGSTLPGLEAAVSARFDRQLRPDLHWRRVSIAPTIDGSAWMAATLFRGEAGSQLRRKDGVLRVRVFDADSREIGRFATVARNSAPNPARDALLAWVQIPPEVGDRWSTVEFEVDAGKGQSPVTHTLSRRIPAPTPK